MVFAFLCHSIAATPVRLLYSAVYGEDMQTALKENVPVEDFRMTRKEQLLQIACRVQSEVGFRKGAKDRVLKGYAIRDESIDGQSFEKGLFRLSTDDPFPTPKTVIWQVSDNCTFVLVCEQDENRILAETILSFIVQYSHAHIMNMDQKMAELLLKGEWLSSVLQVMLNNGQLMFMNSKVIKQLEKQLDAIVLSK
ncbi:PREDICTED: AP-5 complex subunit sigma-1-like [Amphimedon queenslandica]|uniref:AP complex mu/sigma subunit domain-containing protein n=1 Tax=Amphimedon queenslandica TaxID=400682 RepID=A0A1X7VE20_AMPQE|nr:PREDICTED: AP-5 complex subunit sigma-1-like [Amphimedon queenslandica]|eukprot:XP_003384843.1 PREDICTED: AP-5 complex subunit sigma-1-like [Amphimedon queenslandica]